MQLKNRHRFYRCLLVGSANCVAFFLRKFIILTLPAPVMLEKYAKALRAFSWIKTRLRACSPHAQHLCNCCATVVQRLHTKGPSNCG